MLERTISRIYLASAIRLLQISSEKKPPHRDMNVFQLIEISDGVFSLYTALHHKRHYYENVPLFPQFLWPGSGAFFIWHPTVSGRMGARGLRTDGHGFHVIAGWEIGSDLEVKVKHLAIITGAWAVVSRNRARAYSRV